MRKLLMSAICLSIALFQTTSAMSEEKDFEYTVDRFADIQVLRYKVPDFENLSLNQKLLVYYLTEAALSGRDILWDQNGKYNLAIRSLLENIYRNYSGDTENNEFKNFEKYLKQVWFGNGIYHHYSMDKFIPEFSETFLRNQIATLPSDQRPNNVDELVVVIMNPTLFPKKVNQADGEDLILTSASNLYEGVTQQEVEDYYKSIKDTTDLHPVMYGLNSRITKDANGNIVEQTYREGGLYSSAITRIIQNLSEALKYSENPQQHAVITSLIKFYKTGDLKDFDDYSILWVNDTDSRVDFINGFIESYDDPLGMTANWESIVNFKNTSASQRTETISNNAGWFESHSPVDERFKKDEVKGVTAKVITAAILAGDSYPATPIGINLPNSNWIRAEHGSKSVTIENITEAYDEASHGDGFNNEFIPDPLTRELIDNYLFITDNLHTDLHECLGHASGKLLPGVDPDALKAYGSTLEEARADLFALYYLADPKMIELGLIDNPEAYKAQYYKYLLNGLMTQLMRIEPGKDVEEAHMRNRKLISEWVLERGRKDGSLDLKKINGKTTLVVADYPRIRELFGELLSEIQRIKSEGDFDAGRLLVESYGVKVNPKIHKEILDRYSKLSIAPYKGFVNPIYTVITDDDGNPLDVTIRYDEGYIDQMLRYSKDYSTLCQ